MSHQRSWAEIVWAIFVAAVVMATSARAASTNQKSQNPGKIVDACIRAEGGSKGLSSLRTVEIQGTLSDADGKATGTYTLILEQPNRLYQEVTVGAETTREAYNGKSAWRQDRDGLRTLTGPDGAELETTAHERNDRFLHYKKERMRLLLMGDETVRGRAADRLQMTTATGLKREVVIDAASHLMLEEVIPGDAGADSEERVSYDDYRPVDGIAEPYRMEYVGLGHRWVVTVTRVLHNTAVNDAVFAFPAASNRPLPDIATLLKSVEKNQKAIEKLVEQYTCDKTEEEFEVGPRGAPKSKSTKEYQVFYLDGDEVDRLVKKDGKDLSAAEQQKESDHIQKVVEDREKRQAKQAKQGGEDPGKHKDEVQVSDFLRIDRFTNPRRETFRGHEVIVFDFEPNPSYKPASVTEHFLHELSGAVWIDAQAADVARLEAYLDNSFKMAGGLFASVGKGSAFVFEQTKINDEVWLPSYIEAHVTARLLLLKGLHGNYTARYSNYQKFRVETVTKQAPVKSN